MGTGLVFNSSSEETYYMEAGVVIFFGNYIVIFL